MIFAACQLNVSIPRVWKVGYFTFATLLCISPFVAFGQELMPIGLLHRSEDASPGLNLIAPLSAQTVFLMNNDGQIVHRWKTEHRPGMSVHLLKDGSLLMSAKSENSHGFPSTSGSGGLLVKFDWQGNETWRHVIASPSAINHHDIEPLPNGNILCLLWEKASLEESIKAGRDPGLTPPTGSLFESIVELKPTGRNGAEVVWKWNAKDHLHPRKLSSADTTQQAGTIDPNQQRRMTADWLHLNSLDYNPTTDEILVTSRSQSDFWIIDHGVSTQEAAGPKGHLKYRWRNSANLNSEELPRIDSPHDAHWVQSDANRILIFNNGSRSVSESTVEEFIIPSRGQTAKATLKPTPAVSLWHWRPTDFYSPRVSGSQRLPNGNTLVCAGTLHTLIEVRPNGSTAWKYRIPPRFQRPPRQNRNRPRAQTTYTADLTEEQRRHWQSQTQIPLKDGGTMFQAYRYPLDYPAFKGKELATKVEP